MKNIKSICCNSAILLISVLFLAFMGCAGYAVGGASISGYKLIDFSVSDVKAVLLAVGLLIALIAACVMILTSIYGLLRNFEVIKCGKLDKAVKIVNITVTAVALTFLTMALLMDILIAAQYNDKLDKLGNAAMNMPRASAGWGVSVNFTLSIFSLVAAVLDRKVKK